jgi:DivIVA domain-containing protein
VALDRQSIARRDFPTVPRGYDPAAVDAHLAAVADEVDQLHRRDTDRPEGGSGVAEQAGEQVRAIVAAAERSAAAMRDAAGGEAREHVARVAQAADRLRERIDALDRELAGLLATLRGGAERVAEDLDALVAAVDPALGGPAGRGTAAPGVLGATVGQVAGAVVEDEVGDEPALAAVEETTSRLRDVVGARLVALQMATSGRPRDETDRFLAERYDLPDRAALLDSVYARTQA